LDRFGDHMIDEGPAPVERISNPSYGVDLFVAATAGDTLPTTTGYQEQTDYPTSHQAALSAVLADWSSTTDFAGQVAHILDDGQTKGLAISKEPRPAS